MAEIFTLDEITNLIQTKLELKRKCLEFEQKYISTLAKLLYNDASIWTYMFEENVEITEENLQNYVAYSLWNSNEYSKADLLKAVRWLYDGKFNKR